MIQFPKPYADFVQRLRVPIGFLLVAAFAYWSAPTAQSLAWGTPISAAGLFLRAWAAGHLAKNQNLAVSGPYRFTRNPLYLGTLLVAAGLVVASRWIKGGGFSGYSPVKYWLNWGFQQIFRILFRTSIHDLTYGFKLMRAELAHGIAWEGTLHEIACETTLKPVRTGAKVAEVPSKWTARTQGQSKNTFMRNFRYVGTAWRILVSGRPFTPSPTDPVVV